MDIHSLLKLVPLSQSDVLKVFFGALLGSPVSALLTIYFVEPQKARSLEKAKLDDAVNSANRLISSLALRIPVHQMDALAMEKESSPSKTLLQMGISNLLEVDFRPKLAMFYAYCDRPEIQLLSKLSQRLESFRALTDPDLQAWISCLGDLDITLSHYAKSPKIDQSRLNKTKIDESRKNFDSLIDDLLVSTEILEKSRGRLNVQLEEALAIQESNRLRYEAARLSESRSGSQTADSLRE